MADARLPQQVRSAVFETAGFRCEYCLTPMTFCPDPPSVEHLQPRSAGGSDEMSNLATTCQGCNNHKYVSTQSIDPESGQQVLLYHPRLDQWDKHFRWSPDLTAIIGTTPTGRATTERLQLNRPELMNLRRLLRDSGEHPAQVEESEHDSSAVAPFRCGKSVS